MAVGSILLVCVCVRCASLGHIVKRFFFYILLPLLLRFSFQMKWIMMEMTTYFPKNTKEKKNKGCYSDAMYTLIWDVRVWVENLVQTTMMMMMCIVCIQVDALFSRSLDRKGKKTNWSLKKISKPINFMFFFLLRFFPSITREKNRNKFKTIRSLCVTFISPAMWLPERGAHCFFSKHNKQAKEKKKDRNGSRKKPLWIYLDDVLKNSLILKCYFFTCRFSVDWERANACEWPFLCFCCSHSILCFYSQYKNLWIRFSKKTFQ